MSSRRTMSLFKFDLLAAIAVLEDENGGKVKGLDVKAHLEDRYSYDVRHGRLYPNLDELVDLGMVLKRELDGRSNNYALTDRGVRELRSRAEWLGKVVSREVPA